MNANDKKVLMSRLTHQNLSKLLTWAIAALVGIALVSCLQTGINTTNVNVGITDTTAPPTMTETSIQTSTSTPHLTMIFPAGCSSELLAVGDYDYKSINMICVDDPDIQSNVDLSTWVGDTMTLQDFSFSHDMRQLVFIVTLDGSLPDDGSTLFLADLNTGNVRVLWKQQNYVGHLRWSFDDRFLIFTEGHSRLQPIQILEIQTGDNAEIAIYAEKFNLNERLDADINDINWSPTAMTLVYSLEVHEIQSQWLETYTADIDCTNVPLTCAVSNVQQLVALDTWRSATWNLDGRLIGTGYNDLTLDSSSEIGQPVVDIRRPNGTPYQWVNLSAKYQGGIIFPSSSIVFLQNNFIAFVGIRPDVGGTAIYTLNLLTNQIVELSTNTNGRSLQRLNIP